MPVDLLLWEKIRHVDGGHPPPLKEFRFESDKHVSIDVAGVPVCESRGSRQPRDISELRKKCGPAIVGTGAIAVEVQFPDQPPVDLRGELLVLNGGFEDGVTTLYLATYLSAPVTGLIVTTVKAKRIRRGKFGTEAVATFPKIAGGSGSITYFRLELDKDIASATCPDGRLRTRTSSIFADDTRTSASVVPPCTSKG